MSTDKCGDVLDEIMKQMRTPPPRVPEKKITNYGYKERVEPLEQLCLPYDPPMSRYGPFTPELPPPEEVLKLDNLIAVVDFFGSVVINGEPESIQQNLSAENHWTKGISPR